MAKSELTPTTNQSDKKKSRRSADIFFDIIGGIIAIGIIIVIIAIWQDYSSKEEPNVVAVSPQIKSSQPALLKEVDGNYKLLCRGYGYTVEDLSTSEIATLDDLYSKACTAIFGYLADGGKIEVGELTQQQERFKEVRIYGYSHVYESSFTEIKIDDLASFDMQKYTYDPTILIHTTDLAEYLQNKQALVFYALIKANLHVLSLSPDTEEQKANIFGFRIYNKNTEEYYGGGMDSAFTEYLSLKIYDAYSYYFLDAEMLKPQGSTEALHPIMSGIEEVFGSDLLYWYIYNQGQEFRNQFTIYYMEGYPLYTAQSSQKIPDVLNANDDFIRLCDKISQHTDPDNEAANIETLSRMIEVLRLGRDSLLATGTNPA